MRIASLQITHLSRVATARTAAAVEQAGTDNSPPPTEAVSLGSSPANTDNSPRVACSPPLEPLETPPGRAVAIAYWTEKYQAFKENRPDVETLVAGYAELRQMEDPEARRLASSVLGRFSDPLEPHDSLLGMCQRHGEAEGLDQWFRGACRSGAREAEKRKQLPLALKKLDQREGALAEKTLKNLVLLVNRMQEQQPERAQVIEQMQNWWQEGRFEVRREGRPVLPGALKIEELTAGYPAVGGHTLSMVEERPESTKATTFFAQKSAKLEELPRADRQEILQDTLARAFEGNQQARNWERLLHEACRSQTVKADLATMKDELWGLYQHLEPRGGASARAEVSWNMYNHYRATMELFPQDVNARHLKEIFFPMKETIGRGDALIREAIKLKPELKPLALELAQEASRKQGYTDYLVNEMLEDPALVGRDELQMLADSLVHVDTVSGPSKPKKDTIEKAVPKLLEARRRQPGLLENLQAPGVEFEMKPFRFALLDGVLHDWNVEPDFWAKELSEHDRQLFDLIDIDDEALDYVQQKVGKLDNLTYIADSKESALVLLHRWAPERAAEAVRPVLNTPCWDNHIREIAEPARAQVFAEGLARLNPDNRFQEALKLLELAHASDRIDTFQERSAQVFDKVRESGGFEPEQLDSLVGQLRDATSKEKLGPSDYVAAEVLYREDRKEELHQVLTPYLVANRALGMVGAGPRFIGPELLWEELQVVNQKLAKASSADEIWQLVERGTGPARELKGQYTVEFFEAVADRCQNQGLLPDLTNFVKSTGRGTHISLAMLRTALQHTPPHLSRGTSLDALSLMYTATDSWERTEKEFLDKLPSIKKDEDWIPLLEPHVLSMKKELGTTPDPTTQHLDIEMEEDMMWVGDVPLYRD